METNLAHLSDREKEVLRLFGQAHDAKSAADALGVSVNSINERLRDARRKLGATSSREAARMLQDFEAGRHQKNRDKKIDLDIGRAGVRGLNGPKRQRTRNGMLSLAVIGVGIMIGIAFAAWMLLDQSTVQAVAESRSLTPKVVSTSPASGSTVAPGPILLSVTFDCPMLPDAMSFVQVSPETYPRCDGRPVQSRDGRTYSMHCIVEPNRRYEVWFNRPPYTNFRGLDGKSAEPRQLVFKTRQR